MSYIYPVGGTGANPVDNQYEALTIAADTTLQWPFSFTDSALITAQIMHVTASAPSLSLIMPPANQASVGQSIIIKNQGANTFTVKDNAGNTIVSAAAGISYFIYITNNSTVAGAWATLTFGAGSNAVSAASLAGSGLEASGSLLQVDTPGSYRSTNFSLAANDRGNTIIWTGGAGAITIPSSASLGGSGYIVFFSNQGTGNAVFSTSGGELINGAASFTFAAGNSGVIICGAQASREFVVVGFGQSVTFAFTQLIKSVAGSSDVTLTSSEQANKLIRLTGLLTGNINLIVATTPDFFVITNATTGAFSITVKTAAGTGVIASTGLSRTMICDGTNVLYANDVGSGTVTSVATGTGLAGGPITNSGTIDLANTAVAAGAYGGTAGIPSFTVDAQGRLTAAANAIAPGTSGNVLTSDGTAWQSSALANSVPYAAPTVSAAAYLDLAEATGNGTNRLRITTDVALSSDATLTIPGLGGSAVTTDATQTLTNKTLTSPVINIPIISGRTDGGSALAGNVGQIISATLASGSATSLVTNTPKTVTSISLTAGVWAISGLVQYTSAGTTTSTRLDASISATNNTLGTLGTVNVTRYNSSNTGTNPGYGMHVGPVYVSLASTTTYYLVAAADFAVSTLSAYGQIQAVRIQA